MCWGLLRSLMIPPCLRHWTSFYSVFIDIMDTFRMFNALPRVPITFIITSCCKMCCVLLKDDVKMRACSIICPFWNTYLLSHCGCDTSHFIRNICAPDYLVIQSAKYVVAKKQQQKTLVYIKGWSRRLMCCMFWAAFLLTTAVKSDS